MKVSFKRNNFFVLVFILILAVLAMNIFQKEVRSFFYWFSSPIQKSLWQTGDSTSDFFDGLLNYASLNNKIDEMEQRNQGLIAEIIRLKELEEENKTLRGALAIELQKDFDFFVANIISKDISEDVILINKGAKDGVKEGMAAITENKVLVGRIKETYDNYSKVKLLFDKDMSFDVKIEQEEKEISAVAEGKENLQIVLNLIPRQEEVFEGDAVVTSSLGSIFPGSLLIGTIEKVSKNDTDPFQRATIKNALNIFELKNVLIIK